jgi:hypothetical protein
MNISSATRDSYPYQDEPIWSRSEKAIARTAFDAALGPELHEVIQRTKQMANAIQGSTDLWDLEHYLTQPRKEIDRKYDYRYSQTHAGVRETFVPKSTQRGRVARLARGQAEGDPFCRQFPGTGRSVTRILSVNAC